MSNPASQTTLSPQSRATAGRPTRRPLVLGSAAALLLLVGLVLTVPADPEWWKVGVLGIVEGVTEFLPISSTGHLLVAARALDFKHDIGGTFEIFIQLGAVLAVVGYYLRDLLAQARDVTRNPQTRRFWMGIFIAFLPAALVGFVLRKWIKVHLFTPPVIAAALILGGIVFLVVEWLPRRPPTVAQAEQTSLPQALGVGAAQTLALVPGVSRSGAAIVGGMLGGLDRRAATVFSFYLAILTLGAATIVDLLGSLNEIAPGDIGRLFLGAVVSLIVAWVSIGWLLRYVSQHSFVAFGVYRILAGVAIFGLVAMHRI